jgi:glycosyltransferase involved in cell wall biosynthesis
VSSAAISSRAGSPIARVAAEKPLRILIAHQVPAVRNGGMSRLMGFIHDQLETAGHRVDYFCADDVPRKFNGRLARFSFPLLVRNHAMKAARAGSPYDVINVHEPSSAAITMLKGAAGNPRVVVTSHGVERRAWELSLQDRELGRGGPSLKTRLGYPLTSLWQSSLGLRHADHVFCLNEEDRDYLIRQFHLSREKITRIYPAATEIYADAARDRDYSRARRLLFAGSWIKRKGIDDLVQAFTILMSEGHQRLELIVLGAGVPDEVVKKAFPESLRNKVTCVNAESEGEAAAVFSAADIYVLPSLFEGTPLTLVEAMMSALPIVTTATCGMKDLIRSGENGLLVALRAPREIVGAVELLLRDTTLRSRLGRAAQSEALEKYRWEQVAIPVRLIYEQLCSRKS